MAKFVRGTISANMERECQALKKDLIRKGVNPNMLTRPKLQDIILSERAINFRLSLDKIMKILAG